MRAPARFRFDHASLLGLWLGLALALAVVGCNGATTGTSTGNPNDGSSSDGTGIGHTPAVHGSENGSLGGSFCEAEAEVLGSTSEHTRLVDFTAADILAVAQGVHHETIRWHDSELASLGPEKGEHDVTIEVTYDGGEVRAMSPTSDLPDMHGIEPWLVDGCPPWLEIDVHVTMTTDEGALDESFDATLRSRNALFATLFTHPDPDALGGSFAPEEIFEPGFELAQLDLSIGFTPFGVSGSFDGVFEQRTDDSVGAAAGGGAPFADFGRVGCNYNSFAVALDDMVEQASAQDVLQMVMDAHDLAIDWSDGTSTSATLAFTPGQAGACVLLADQLSGGVTFVVDGELALASADGKVDAHWPVSARGRLGQSGAIEQVDLVLRNDRPQLPEDNGVPGADVSGYDSSQLNFMLAISPDGANAVDAMGELRVIGYKFAPCASQPVMPTPTPMGEMSGTASGGSGTAGCRGADTFAVLFGAIASSE